MDRIQFTIGCLTVANFEMREKLENALKKIEELEAKIKKNA